MLEAIILDLGGVILNIDYAKTLVAFSQLAGQDISSLYTQHRQIALFDRYETGQISSEEFRQGLRSQLALRGTADDAAIDSAWNAMLLDVPPARLDSLAQLSERFRLFLLSNTNAIHKAAFEENLEAVFGDAAVLSRQFEATHYSHLMGDRKPNPTIFQRVVDEQGLIPSQTLFVDDTAGHLQGAQAVGLQTIHMAGDLTLEMLTRQLLIA